MSRTASSQVKGKGKDAEWLYKIIPHSSVDTRFTFPIPIPASHQFFLPALDLSDGFVHLSTASQVSGVLNRFFQEVPSVVLLRLENRRLSGFKRVIWENSNGDLYPHLYAHLEGENVDSFKEVHKGESEKGWDTALQKIDEWMV